MATRYFHADNCLRVFKVAGKEINFKPYTNSGSWRGTFVCTDDADSDGLAALAGEPRNCIREITANEFSKLTGGGAPPLQAYEPIRIGEAAAQKIAAKQVAGEPITQLLAHELPTKAPEVIDIEAVAETAQVETHAMSQEPPAKRRPGRPSKSAVISTPENPQ